MQYINVYIESIFNTCQVSTLGGMHKCSFIHSFIHLLFIGSPPWCRYFKSTQSAAEHRRQVLCPCGAYVMVLSLFTENESGFQYLLISSPSWSHCFTLKYEALRRRALFVVWGALMGTSHPVRPQKCHCSLLLWLYTSIWHQVNDILEKMTLKAFSFTM